MKKITLSLSILLLSCAGAYSQALEPNDTLALLKVTVLNKEGKPVADEKIIMQSAKTQKVYSFITNADGKFELLLPDGCAYSVKIQQLSGDADNKKLNIPLSENLTFSYTITINAESKTYTLHNVFFDTGKSILKPESDKELDKLAEYMSYKKSMVIEIGGYTDNVGQDQDNQKLSEARANAVRSYLIHKGIGADKISAKGFGAADPVASNDTPDGKQLNRRTEVHILHQ